MHLSVNVLHLRGDDIAKQPIQDDDGNILTWNGEIFSGMNVRHRFINNLYIGCHRIKSVKLN